VRDAIPFAISAGGVGLFDGHGTFLTRGGEFKHGELDAAIFAKRDIAFTGFITDRAGAGVAEIEEVVRQRSELHGGDCNAGNMKT
jgi:hypothetical protein